MEYSSDDIAAARSLQFFRYTYMSATALWIYDYACSLHEEWTFLLRSDWSKVKGLYIVTRYHPFIYLTTVLWKYFTTNENQDTCRVLTDLGSGLAIASIIFSECFFILRTYVLWNKNKILLAAMASTCFVFLVASLGSGIADTVPTTYCHKVSGFGSLIPFLLLIVFELGLMILTLIRAIQSWRMSSSRLYVVLVKHNIFYYTCGLLLSGVNVLAILLFQYSYDNILYIFEVIHNPCDPRYAHAPPSLADEPTCVCLWRPRAYYKILYIIYEFRVMMHYPVAHLGSFIERGLDRAR
ncbi:hypothetical protein BDR07DRAFT_1087872 [Suillus spraguei]|nr:hypothetical protein BDR07DRAFT_1087872 [Suillus spraguei]